MKKSRFKFNLVDVLKTILMFSLLIGYGSVISVFSPIASDLLTMVCIVLLMLVNKKCLMDKKIFKVLISIYGVTFFSALLTHSSIFDYAGVCMRSTFVALIITAFGNNYRDITKYFIKSLWLLSYLALINFILTMILEPFFIETYSSSGFRVRTIGLVFNYMAVSDILGLQFVRNQAIFWEPGVLQIPINILIYYLIIEENKSLKEAILPIFILLTTASTTGFIVLMFILLVRFRKSFSLRGVGLLRTTGILLVIVIFTPILVFEVNQKFSSEGGQFSSTARLYDMYMSFNVISNFPLFGIGMNQESYFNAIEGESVDIDGERFSEERGNTNTILSMFIKFGIPLAVLLIYFLYKQNLFRYRFVFFVIMFFSLMSEPLLVVYLLILIIMSSIKITDVREIPLSDSKI